MTLSTEERNAIVSIRIEKAIQAFHEAKGNIQMQFWNTVINRLYYACYNITSALLIKKGHSAQSHKGVATLLGLNYINTGIIPKEIGKTYHRLFLLRQIGDYDDFNMIDEEDVINILEPAEAFIKTIKDLLKE